MVKFMLFHEEMKLVRLHFWMLNLCHTLSVILKQLLQTSEVSIAKIILYLMKKIFLLGLWEPIVFLFSDMVLLVVLITWGGYRSSNFYFLRWVLEINDFNFCVRLHYWDLRMLWSFSLSHVLLLFETGEIRLSLVKFSFWELSKVRVIGDCSLLLSFEEQIRV